MTEEPRVPGGGRGARQCDRVAVLIYKILLPAEWAAFDALGHFDGSPFDDRSGFVHCSSRAQVGATAARIFPDEPELVIVVLDTERLGDCVRWEPAPGGEEFPHVYASLPGRAVVGVHRVAGAAQVDEVLALDDRD